MLLLRVYILCTVFEEFHVLDPSGQCIVSARWISISSASSARFATGAIDRLSAEQVALTIERSRRSDRLRT